MGINTSLNNLGLAKTSATLSILIEATSDIWTLLFDFIIFKVKPPKMSYIMILMIFAGSALIAVSAYLYKSITND